MNKTNKTPKVEEWEIKLTQLVSLAWKNGLWHSESNFMNAIKHFIHQVIEEERRRLIKEILNQEKCIFLNIQKEFIKSLINPSGEKE